MDNTINRKTRQTSNPLPRSRKDVDHRLLRILLILINNLSSTVIYYRTAKVAFRSLSLYVISNKLWFQTSVYQPNPTLNGTGEMPSPLACFYPRKYPWIMDLTRMSIPLFPLTIRLIIQVHLKPVDSRRRLHRHRMRMIRIEVLSRVQKVVQFLHPLLCMRTGTFTKLTTR
jgi:hypothetical protein